MYSETSPLDAVESAFRLLTTGPGALELDGAALDCGLPPEPIPLAELRELIVRRRLDRRAQDAVWRELIERSRRGEQVWTLAAVGLALPGLRNIAGRLAAGYRGDPADLDAEILTGFLEALDRRVNPKWTYLAYCAERGSRPAGGCEPARRTTRDVPEPGWTSWSSRRPRRHRGDIPTSCSSTPWERRSCRRRPRC